MGRSQKLIPASEARYLGQRVAVIHEGRIEQEGPVAEVFQNPRTPFVRQFLMNS